MLQYQNHQLVQQLDHQRSEISALKNKCCQFKIKQASYDDTLITVNRAWTTVSVTSFFRHCQSIDVSPENLYSSYTCSYAFSGHST